MMQIHGGCVSLNGAGVLIRGPSGAGKSDMALRLIDQGGRLVSDDRTDLFASEGHLFAAPPEKLAGLMEIRGVGLVDIPHIPWAAIRLVIDLVPADQVDRLPEPAFETLCGIEVRKFDLWAFEPSAPAKIHAIMALQTR